jgi:hypothetical protein
MSEINYIQASRFVVHKSKPYDIPIFRPSKWGNPFSYKDGTLAKFKVETREESLTRFEEWIRTDVEKLAEVKKELKGRILGCYCKSGEKCHGHILAWIANFEE